MVRWLKGLLAALLPACAAVAPRGGPPPPAASPGDQEVMRIAFVLLESPVPPDAREVVAAFRQIAPPGPAESFRLTGPAAEPRDAAAVFDLGEEGQLVVGLLDRPVPDGEADYWSSRSLAGASSDWRLPPHQAHLLVLWREYAPRPALESVQRFTWMLAAVARAAGGLGIYWADSGATHPADYFARVAAERASPRAITLWSGVSVGSDGDRPGRFSLLSTGMTQLGLIDLELTGPLSVSKEDALELLYRLLRYELQRGAPIPAGETFGRTKEERLPVRHLPSPADPSKTVWRIDLPAAAPPP